MFGPIDLPDGATITHEDESTAANQATAILTNYESQICAAVHCPKNSVVVVHAATGTGKSKVLPSLLQRTLQRPLLCLVTSTVDVVDMFDHATVSASYCMGNGRRGRNHKLGDSQIVFATSVFCGGMVEFCSTRWLIRNMIHPMLCCGR
jgi:hypothetical protein